jgi:hypothetical protein
MGTATWPSGATRAAATQAGGVMTDRWKRLCWTEDGDIDVRRQVFAHSDLPTTIEREANLRAMLVAVWADAYTHGWSDGKAGREPNDRENPYTSWSPPGPSPTAAQAESCTCPEEHETHLVGCPLNCGHSCDQDGARAGDRIVRAERPHPAELADATNCDECHALDSFGHAPCPRHAAAPAHPLYAPVQGDRKIQPGRPGHDAGKVAWSEHLEAWRDYAKRYGNDQSAERLAERGGFGYLELVEHLGRLPETWQPR